MTKTVRFTSVVRRGLSTIADHVQLSLDRNSAGPFTKTQLEELNRAVEYLRYITQKKGCL
jgi:hypothetical protein